GLGEARPADLAQLGGDLVRDLVRPRVDPQVEGGGAGQPEPDDRAPGPLAGERAGERLGHGEGGEGRQQHVLEEQARREREHDVSDGDDAGVRHESTEAIGRPARTRTWNMRFWRPPLYHWSYWPTPRLLRLLVLGVLAAARAELGQDQLVGHGPLVLGGRVVPLLGHGALEGDDGSVHASAPDLEPTTRIELVTSSLPRKCSAD